MTQYRRLPGKGLRRGGFLTVARTWCTLWLASDHVLSVDTHLFSEDYKRFYLRDIQSITLAKTRRGFVWNIILSCFIALWLAVMFFQSTMEGRIAWLVVTAIFGILLTLNVVRGPTCICHIVTAVHQEALPSLDRIKKAEKVLRILRRHIENAQMNLAQTM